MKSILYEERFGLNDEITERTEAYFEDFHQSFHRNSWIDCIILKGNCVAEHSSILEKRKENFSYSFPKLIDQCATNFSNISQYNHNQDSSQSRLYIIIDLALYYNN